MHHVSESTILPRLRSWGLLTWPSQDSAWALHPHGVCRCSWAWPRPLRFPTAGDWAHVLFAGDPRPGEEFRVQTISFFSSVFLTLRRHINTFIKTRNDHVLLAAEHAHIRQPVLAPVFRHSLWKLTSNVYLAIKFCWFIYATRVYCLTNIWRRKNEVTQCKKKKKSQFCLYCANCSRDSVTLGGSDNKFAIGPACGYSGMVTVLELKTNQCLYRLGFAVPHKRSIF